MSDTTHDPAQHSVDIAVLKNDMERLTGAVERLSQKMDTLSAQMTAAGGGWRMAMIAGTIIIALASAMSWVLSHFQWKP